ncbi:MAG: RidA family protein [Proteobacteria bacterium]|nr:RidA family protein [Pseudomonadota bacterium]
MSKDIIRYEYDQRLSDMVEYAGRLYLSGQVGEDASADMKGQTASILQQIDKLLARGGSDKSKILSAVVFVADMRLKPAMDEAWLAWMEAKSSPARATVEARLGSADTLVEIMCVAAKSP